MEEGRLFGRTSLGGQEILQKSGRLTQTERLVLIVLGDQIRFEALAAKLSSLAPERVERALIRLVELNLAYETQAAPVDEAAGAATIPAGAMREFLEQGEADPVTVMANTEQLDGAERARALKDAVGQVLGGDEANVAVPLGKLFPERGDPAALARNERREMTQSKLGALEQSLERSRVPNMAVPAPPLRSSRRPAAEPVQEEEEAVIIETPKNSSAGGVMILIGGVGAVIVVATILLYALR